MGLTRLGNFIEQSFETNKNLNLTADFAAGMTITKEVIPTKANLSGTDLTNFLIVKPHYFIMNPRTHGKYIGLGFNNTGNTLIISWNNIAFKVKDENVLDPTFLFIMLRRPERDRWATKNSWGTSTEVFTFETLCSYEFYLPPIEIQRKYVAIYEGLLANLHSYENKLEELKFLCDAYIEDLRKKYSLEDVGTYVEQYKEINNDLKVAKLAGLIGGNIEAARASSGQDNLAKFQIIYPKSIVYPPPHFGEVGTIGLVKEEAVLMSPMYVTFRAKSDEKINMGYLLLWFRRKEFMRYAFFQSSDSIRDTFDFYKLAEYKIPVPPIEIQNSIVEVFNIYNERKEYVSRLKNIIKDICPLLVRGAIKEASEVK